jgi:hypothetical protein
LQQLPLVAVQWMMLAQPPFEVLVEVKLYRRAGTVRDVDRPVDAALHGAVGWSKVPVQLPP